MDGGDDLLGPVPLGLRGQSVRQQTAKKPSHRQQEVPPRKGLDKTDGKIERSEKPGGGRPDHNADKGGQNRPFDDGEK